jgi:hypothetical protein
MATPAKIMIDAIQKLERVVVPAETAVILGLSQNDESSQDPNRLKAAKALFEKKIKPHYQDRFNKMGGVEAIFVKIKEMILEEYLKSLVEHPESLKKAQESLEEALQSPDRNKNEQNKKEIARIKAEILKIIAKNKPIIEWISSNKAILIDIKHPQYPTVLVESRKYLNSYTDVNQIAWRNFDENSPMMAIGRINWFVGKNRYGNYEHEEIRERLAYHYLAITDEQAVPDLEERQSLRTNFIYKFGDCRRKNADVHPNLQQGNFDVPACDKGTLGREADMGQGHPISQLWFTPEEALPSFVAAKSVEKLNRLLEDSTEQERKKIIENLQKPLSQFSNDDLALRNEILKAWDVRYSEILQFYTLEGDWVWEIEGKLLEGTRFREIHKQKIILMLLDPISYFGDKIRKMYNALPPVQQQNVPQAFAFAPVQPAIGNKKPLDWDKDYLACLQKEREYAAEMHMKWGATVFFPQFEEGAVKERISEALTKMGHQGGNQEKVVEAMIRIENANLLKDYTQQFIAGTQEAGKNFNHAEYRKKVVAKLIREKEVAFVYLSLEQQEECIQRLDRHIKDLQAIPKEITPHLYQQLAPAQQLNIATIAHQPPKLGPSGSLYQTRTTFNIDSTGPGGTGTGPMGTTIDYPRLPVVHPQNPTGKNNDVPYFSLAISFLPESRNHVPTWVRAFLIEHDIALENLEIFCCAQNRPWEKESLLLRPHPWLHSNAPLEGHYSEVSNILVGICDIDSNMASLAHVSDISTQGKESNPVMYVGAELSIQGVEDDKKSHAFYSFCVDPTKRRAALTLHMLWNKTDSYKLNGFFCGYLGGGISSQDNLVPGMDALCALIQGNHPASRQNVQQYRLKEQVGIPQSLSIPADSDKEALAIEYLENSMRSLLENTFSNAENIKYLQRLETRYFQLGALLQENRKRKGKAKSTETQHGTNSQPMLLQYTRSTYEIHPAPLVSKLPQSQAGSVQDKLKADAAVLSAIVLEYERMKKEKKTKYYLYNEGKIILVDILPSPIYGNHFDLGDKAEEKNKKVYYKPEDTTKFYGNHGFVHRVNSGTPWPIKEAQQEQWRKIYEESPKRLSAVSIMTEKPQSPAPVLFLSPSSIPQSQAGSIQDKLKADAAVLSEIVLEYERIKKEKKTKYYLYSEGKIVLVDTLPSPINGNYFDLGDKTGEKNQLIYYKPEDTTKFYGNYGFVHRINSGTPWPIKEAQQEQWRKIYEESPLPLIRENQQRLK